ncbi:DUF748 domain-containing protein [Duganella phyllosphaerae]|uniref:AsmA family protein n=1 Tax=Duganella phyllosphaerae TaxID=762836 RepID=A0A1E7X4C6_9BURK|nr:DUF748 domain-containing protein [Duganella phyllosphaerae]OFA07258.1 hypothetical protein DUPY_13660 [Duganella phyllosphaerae]
MGKRWKRWSLGVAGAVGLYAAAGGWVLPQLLKAQLPKLAESRLERKASVGALRFNPFTLRLEAQDLVLTEADGAPLLAVGALAVELQWRSLLRRAWTLAEVRIVAPSAQLAIDKNGSFNLARLIDTLNRDRTEEPPAPAPRLVIEHFVLEQGKLALHDRHAGYDDTYTPIAFELRNLSTLPNQHGDYTLSADAGRGGKLHWQGRASLAPLSGSGALVLRNVALPGLAPYLQTLAGVTLAQGRLSATLPYHYAYADGKLDARLPGASITLDRVALGLAGRPALKMDAHRIKLGLGLHARTAASGVQLDIDQAGLAVEQLALANGAAAPVTVARLGIEDGALDLAARRASVGRFYAEGGELDLSRDAAGKLRLLEGWQTDARDTGRADGGNPGNPAHDGGGNSVTVAEVDGGTNGTNGSNGSNGTNGTNGSNGRSGNGTNGHTGDKTGVARSAPAGKPWAAVIESVQVRGFGALVDDAASGVKVHLEDFFLNLAHAGTDLERPVVFDGGVGLREGGQLSASGSFVPAGAVVDATLALNGLALAPLQPLLDKHVKLQVADGSVSAAGRLRTGGSGSSGPSGSHGADQGAPALRYDGWLEVARLALNEHDGDHFAHWKSVRADQVALTLGPDRLEVAELRVVEPNAILIINSDRSLNAQRLLVQRPVVAPTTSAPAAGVPAEPLATGAAPTAAPAGAATSVAGAPATVRPVGFPATRTEAIAEPFPVRVRRVRVENAKLDFTDLSLRPQFAARVVELNGIVSGLSTRPGARAQIELDGRVDDYGLARIRGQLNPFALTDHTDVQVMFKNLDLVSASPYSMKFAGYKIAQGKVSLDLDYQVRHGALQGSNRMVLDQLTLGERIDSPDALKLPLELALALLKDADGRIDLGVPVSGNLDDPQFSYGAVLWKAVGNIMTRAVTAPFRALGRLFGVDGERLQAVEFDAGSDRLLPPEREKLQQVAQLLAKKPELALAVPARYSRTADGLALRTQALRRTVLARAGVRVEADEQPGPLDLGGRKLRAALRDLYAERFGKDALAQQKLAAEQAGGGGAADLGPVAGNGAVSASASAAAAAGGASGKLPLLQRLGKLVQGEPQVADPSAFYAALQAQLVERQELAADALSQLAARRAATIVAQLKLAGAGAHAGAGTVAVKAGAPEDVKVAPGRPVALALELSAR